MFSVLGAEARRLMLPGPVVAAAHCKTHQKLFYYYYYYFYLKDSPAGWALIEGVSNELRLEQWEKSQG